MKLILSSVITILFIVSCSSPEGKDALYVVNQPAEFEAQEAIWLIWPSTDHKEGESVKSVTLSVIEALKGTVKIIVTCKDTILLSQATTVLTRHFGNLEDITLAVLPSYEIWSRDMGPVFVRTNRNTLAVADFNFNSWGYADTLEPDARTEEMYDVRAAEYLGLPVISSAMISEGGNREVNGKGTLMTNESVEAGRNPNMTKLQMEGNTGDCWG